MDRDVAVMHEVLEDLRGQLFKVLEPLTDDDVNRTYPGLTNTIGILLRHMAASERYWVAGIAGGGPLERDRDGEFGHEPLSKTTLVEGLRQVQRETDRVLESLSGEQIRALVKAQRSRGMVDVSRAWAIMHAVQHLAHHLGQVRLMAAMARASRAA